METKIERWFWTRDLAERYNCSTRTIERMKKSKKLPTPTRMPNGRDAWADVVIYAHERSLVSNTAA